MRGDPCGLAEAGTEFSRKPYALAVQKGSRLKEELSAGREQLRFTDYFVVTVLPRDIEAAEHEEAGDAEGKMVSDVHHITVLFCSAKQVGSCARVSRCGGRGRDLHTEHWRGLHTHFRRFVAVNIVQHSSCCLQVSCWPV